VDIHQSKEGVWWIAVFVKEVKWARSTDKINSSGERTFESLAGQEASIGDRAMGGSLHFGKEIKKGQEQKRHKEIDNTYNSPTS